VHATRPSLYDGQMSKTKESDVLHSLQKNCNISVENQESKRIRDENVQQHMEQPSGVV
jgi:hypothetical protein